MGIKISALPAIVTPALTDVFPVVQGSVTYKETITQLSALIAVSGGTVNAGLINEVAYYASAGNAVSGLATANNGLLVTSNTGVPSILGGPGVSGKILQSNAAAAPSYSTPTYPSTSGAAGKVLASDGTNIVYSTATFPATAGATGTILRSNGTDWVASTATFADTYASSTFLYSNGVNTVTGLATANSAALVTDSTGVPVWSASMTNGQLIIGSTGATPTAATLTGGTGISISTGAGSITISASASGLAWNTIAGTTQAAAVNSGYVVGNAAQTTITLPAVFAVGEVVIIKGFGAAGWILAANAGDTIQIGQTATSAGGSLTSAGNFDTAYVTGIVANTTWSVDYVLSTGLTVA